MGAVLPYDTLAALRAALVAQVPHLELIDEVMENEWQPLKAGKLGKADFVSAVKDHFLTNPIARASSLMAELSAGVKARADTAIAAE